MLAIANVLITCFSEEYFQNLNFCLNGFPCVIIELHSNVYGFLKFQLIVIVIKAKYAFPGAQGVVLHSLHSHAKQHPAHARTADQL